MGLALSWWASLYLLRIALASDGTLPIDLSPDARAIGFAILMSVVTSVLFGLMPALRATARMTRSAGRGPRGPRKRWLERSLVGAQSALSLVLVVFAALFVRTLQNLWTLDPGYDRTNVVMFSIDAGLAGKRGAERTRTYQSVLDAVGAMPGATSVSASVVAPVSTSYYFGTLVTQAGATAFPDERRLEIADNLTAPGYFATLRIPLLTGRDFDARDRIGSPAVAIVSEQLAARFAGNPIGQRLVTADGEYDVIGVARDTRYANIRDAPRDVAYFAMLQSPNIGYAPTVVVRHAGSASDAVRSARAVVASVAEDLTLFQTTTLETRTRESLSRERLLALLSAYAGGFALLLACIGLYGLMMYGVTQRTPELGLRMALGSPPSAIRRIVLREGVATVLAGAVAGFGAAWILVRLVRTQLYAIEPTDPVAFAASILLLVTVAAAAAYLPAWRASRIDPVIALRQE